MLPVELDHKKLNSFPFPTDKAVSKVFQVLEAVLSQKTFPYYRDRRGASPARLSEIRQSLSFRRMEDEDSRIGMATLLVSKRRNWMLLIHERLFDYLALILSGQPEIAFTAGTQEEQKTLVFCRFLLRHYCEHLLFPEKTEAEVIRSDLDFAADLRGNEPESYRGLREILAEGINGIGGRDYLELLDRVERGAECDVRMARIIARYARNISELPSRFLLDIFPGLELDLKMRVLSDCYRGSRSMANPLVKREAGLRKVLRMFALTIGRDPNQGFELFQIFRKRWGLESLFRELDLPEDMIERRSTHQLFEAFSKNLEEFVEPGEITQRDRPAVYPQARTETVPQPPKTLKERIEEARSDPNIPQQVLEVVEKNKVNAAGQSGAKYTELIETLLNIPWGRIKKIRISPEEFEDGLNRSHFGLKKPKEIICDFFANLIWRYQHFREVDKNLWRRTGSALLFVGPPGVGKTSLAISIARNLGIPYHKLSLGGMKDEADIRGYGFTYEGSKPGPIVQGLVKMGVMNGMFIMDEADKTEKLAIATLLEILDPEQNHLFHDKYTQSTVDIDLSNCHFILTANTIDTVPSAIINRCEVIFLDRYSVEEKIAIAKEFLIERIRDRYLIGADEIFFDPEEENEILRHLIRQYTFEAGVRDLERIIRMLFLRVQRKDILGGEKGAVKLALSMLPRYLDEPPRPRLINTDDRIGEMMGLGVNMELGIGTLIPIQVTPMKVDIDSREAPRSYISMVHTTGNIERVMDESRKVASTAILQRAKELRLGVSRLSIPVHLHFMGGSTKKDGPSAGSAIALALASLYTERPIRRDVAMTGEIDTQGRITSVGGIGVKLETAYAAGCKTLIIPMENLQGGDAIDRLPEALRQELQILTYAEWKGEHEPFDYSRHVLQVVAVENIVEAADIAFLNQEELDSLDDLFEDHARKAAAELEQCRIFPHKHLRLLYVDHPAQVNCDLLQSRFCREDYGCVILVRKDVKEDIIAKLPWHGETFRIREFDPSSERLRDVIEETRTQHAGEAEPPLWITIVAPLPFLRREGIRSEDFTPDARFLGVRFLAGCCTAENLPIRGCTSTVGKTYMYLSMLPDDLLRACPFVAEKDGVYSTTVRFIPEKYRIDARRAEEILERGVTKWLRIMGGETDETETPVQPGGLKI